MTSDLSISTCSRTYSEFQGLKLWQKSSNSEAMSPSLPALPSLPSTVWQDTVFPSRANPFPVSRW